MPNKPTNYRGSKPYRTPSTSNQYSAQLYVNNGDIYCVEKC